jgi:uncharacterized OB-fold protein
MTRAETTVPVALIDTVTAHGRAVAAGDDAAVLADFLADRVGQLVASADVPARLADSEVRRVDATDGGLYDATIRYTEVGGRRFELRSRWVQCDDGRWRVFSVRNIPETAPWIDATGPSADGLDSPHWAGLREGTLLLQRCVRCNSWIWAPRPICSTCHSFELSWQPVEPVGTIYSWTRTWQPFTPESTGHLPYVVVLVELPAAQHRRVLGILADVDGLTPAIGASLRGYIEQPPTDEHWPLVRWHLDGAWS